MPHLASLRMAAMAALESQSSTRREVVEAAAVSSVLDRGACCPFLQRKPLIPASSTLEALTLASSSSLQGLLMAAQSEVP